MRMIHRNAIFVCFAISLILNLFQMYRINHLSKSEYGNEFESLRIAQHLNGFSAKDIEERDAQLEYDTSSPTLFYVFHPECVWCVKNAENISMLAAVLRGKYRIVGISLSKRNVKKYVQSNDVKYPVLVDIPQNTIDEYKLGSTPQTIVVDKDGYVDAVWHGAYFGSLQSEIEKWFSIELPGLAETPDSAADL